MYMIFSLKRDLFVLLAIVKNCAKIFTTSQYISMEKNCAKNNSTFVCVPGYFVIIFSQRRIYLLRIIFGIVTLQKKDCNICLF